MRLQRLELSGFKSFPERAEVAFDHGVTAIVGPNGCGKSNLVDAITWVLGEQSAKSLRGDRMEDLIFSGSDARKPTAAAEVKLRLAGVTSSVPARLFGPRRSSKAGGNGNGNGNGNGHATAAVVEPEALPLESEALVLGSAMPADEEVVAPPPPFDDDLAPIVCDVEVGRRLYRSGESEYLIDGEVVRLRDVHDLLMDAGLGVKGYAVIEQGKIGQILTSAPTARRQLIEEAAGVTKYKTRRRAAELKLEAAQQNLTRIDDVIFEVEKQRNALKRQAAKARRHRRLREELRRWEKVAFARRYRVLAQAIESARARLAEARERESAAAAHVAEVEAAFERLRIDLTEAETGATASREAAHARELEIGRLQQQIAFDRQQVSTLDVAAGELDTERQTLEARREPAAAELAARREAVERAEAERDQAAQTLADAEAAQQAAQLDLEGLEGDVEAARSEVFSALNAATALRHAVEHAGTQRERITEELGKLDIEHRDLQVEAERATAERDEASGALAGVRAAIDAARTACAVRETERAEAVSRRDALAAECRALEQEVTALKARLASLEELDAARAEYGDAARLILAESNGNIRQLGSVADYLEVDRRYERAVDAWLGDLLEHVVVERHEHAAAGLDFVRERNAGRCGFLVVEGGAEAPAAQDAALEGLEPMTSVVQIGGPYRAAIAAALGQAWVAESFEAAAVASRRTNAPIATLAGDVFHGPHLVFGGARTEARGILATKREIKELRARVTEQEQAVTRLSGEVSALDAVMSDHDAAIATLTTESHEHEKAIVGFELRLARAQEEADRVARKQEQVESERRGADEERRALEARQAEALASIQRLEVEQREADERLTAAQSRLLAAREAVTDQSARMAEVKAAHAALVERASGLLTEVRRLDDAVRDLDERIFTCVDEHRRTVARRHELDDRIVASERQLDADLRGFDALRDAVRQADERCAALRDEFDAQDHAIRDARRALEAIRADVSQLDVTRVTAESDLMHLAESCLETTQTSLDDVAAEVERMEQDGTLEAERTAAAEPEPADDLEGEGEPQAASAEAAAQEPAAPAGAPATAEEMVAQLRAKVDRLGPVNMMAIEQFDELETRHEFLTVQRKDLVDSIAATGDAIKRIEKTTKERFQEAFTVINEHFQKTFTTLFGGGRAGLILIDETDQLESGVDIIAQPPGKRLQNVQLLSGGEKALTAMALMFALFKYRPSPFCLLDEIDAPLDDANIGRFVEMLQGMQDHTQFVLITHNRKTMEIADRLYGVTMEEPGVSKLISVQLN
jgi:chromosome segregation protein